MIFLNNKYTKIYFCLIEKSKNQFLQQKIDELTRKLESYSKKKKKDELALDGQSF